MFQSSRGSNDPPCPCLWAPMLRNPIEKFRGVGISTDLHPKEREDIIKMIEEAKQVHIDTESEDVENYRFLVVGKGIAKKLIKIRRNSSFLQGYQLSVVWIITDLGLLGMLTQYPGL